MKKIFVYLISMLFAINFLSVNCFAVNEDENDNGIDISDVIYMSNVDSSEWRVVERYNMQPVLTTPIDYTSNPDLLNNIKRGDIIYEPTFGNEVLGDIVGHVALVVDVFYDTRFNQKYVLLIEAVNSNGDNGIIYSALTPTRFETVNSQVLRIEGVSEQQINNAIEFAIEQYGKPYSIDFPNVNVDSSNTSWYCSELLYAAFFHQNLYLAPDIGFVHPVSILNSPLTHCIMKYGEERNVIVRDEYHIIECNGDTYFENHDYRMLNSCYNTCKTCNYQLQLSEHSYNYIYESYNQYYHKAICRCGDFTLLGHNLIPDGNYLLCDFCDYSKLNCGHTNISYTADGFGRQHTVICSCGYSYNESCIGISNGMGNYMCLKCGQLINLGNGSIIFSNDETIEIKKKEENDDDKI